MTTVVEFSDSSGNDIYIVHKYGFHMFHHQKISFIFGLGIFATVVCVET